MTHPMDGRPAHRITPRPDDFTQRRKHLADLNDQQLHARFWELADKVVDPLVALARTHTTPSLERSVLLRMGLDSLVAKAIVDRCLARRLLGKGAGHVVLRFAQSRNLSVQQAARLLVEDERSWDEVEALFAAGAGAGAGTRA